MNNYFVRLVLVAVCHAVTFYLLISTAALSWNNQFKITEADGAMYGSQQAVLLGRHPVFDREMDFCGYEFLFHNFPDNAQNFLNPELSTYQVLDSAFASIAADELIADGLCFINVTTTLLEERHIFALPKHRFVFELNAPLSQEHLEIIREYAADGFQFCLSNFIYNDQLTSAIELVDYIRLDTQHHGVDGIKQQLALIRQSSDKLVIAEKVESINEFKQLYRAGIDFFQGYFFCKPQIVEGRPINTNAAALLALLAELNDDNTEIDRVEQLIIQDAGLSYKIVRLVNSPIFQLTRKIQSLHHAIVMLGLDKIRSLASISIVTSAGDKSQQLIVHLLIRAKMLALLGTQLNLENEDMLFTIGYFSGLDAILDMPMAEIVDSLNLHHDISEALLNKEGVLGNLLDLIICYETGDWERFSPSRNQYKELADIDDAAFVLAYSEAVLWSNSINYDTTEAVNC